MVFIQLLFVWLLSRLHTAIQNISEKEGGLGFFIIVIVVVVLLGVLTHLYRPHVDPL